MRILSITAQKPSSTGSGVYLTELVKEFARKGHSQAVVAGVYREDQISLPAEVGFYPVYFQTEALPYPIAGMSDEMPYPSTRYCDMTEEMTEAFGKAFLEKVTEAVEALDPDLILCHHLYLLTALVREHFPDRRIYGFCHNTDIRQMEKTNLKRAYIAGQIRKLIESTNGHTLVLFTSYTMMGNVYRELKGKVSVPILRVWKDSQRVIREFKEHKNAVLFAAGSCWEGMDFPGDMVSSLIIVRLPFPVPDPVREAERERYQSLQEYIRQIVVPDMQLKLRQGFGRAIRTETDTCVVSILDSRAARGRRYHEAVLEALPRCQMTEDIGDVERFIREKKGIDYYM